MNTLFHIFNSAFRLLCFRLPTSWQPIYPTPFWLCLIGLLITAQLGATPNYVLWLPYWYLLSGGLAVFVTLTTSWLLHRGLRHHGADLDYATIVALFALGSLPSALATQLPWQAPFATGLITGWVLYALFAVFRRGTTVSPVHIVIWLMLSHLTEWLLLLVGFNIWFWLGRFLGVIEFNPAS